VEVAPEASGCKNAGRFDACNNDSTTKSYVARSGAPGVLEISLIVLLLLFVAIFIDIVRARHLSVLVKVLWLLIALAFPLAGSALWFIFKVGRRKASDSRIPRVVNAAQLAGESGWNAFHHLVSVPVPSWNARLGQLGPWQARSACQNPSDRANHQGACEGVLAVQSTPGRRGAQVPFPLCEAHVVSHAVSCC
jgi:hypothetical protein